MFSPKASLSQSVVLDLNNNCQSAPVYCGSGVCQLFQLHIKIPLALLPPLALSSFPACKTSFWHPRRKAAIFKAS